MPVVSSGAFTITDLFDGITIFLSSSSFVVPTDDLGSAGTFTGCSSTVKVMNGKDDITSSYTISAVGSVGLTGSLSGKTYTATAMTTDTGTVDFTATRLGFETLTARFTITKAKKGSDGLTVIFSNENHTFPAANDGTVSNYANSGTIIQVLEGANVLTAASSATANGSFTIGTPTISPAGTITVGARSYSGTTATVAQHSAMASGTNQLAISYPITIKLRNGSTRTLVRTQTITKSIQGSAGSPGVSGPNGLNFSEAKMLFSDPAFQSGTNSCNLYNNSGNGNTILTREAKQADSPYADSGFNLKISNIGSASPGLGGYYQIFTSRASAVFVQRIIAKIPVGYNIVSTSNVLGDGATVTWLTPTAGTGTFQEYIVVIRCGATGSFSTGGHIFISGAYGTPAAPVNWYLAYTTIYDFTALGFGNVTGVLSNEAHTVPTDSAGNNGNFTGAATAMTIYNGSADDSVNWAVTAAPINCAGSLSGKTYTVTSMSADVAYVDLTATRSGYGNIVKRFTLTRSKQGSAGAGGTSATSYWMLRSAGAIQKSVGGALTPTSLTVTIKSQTGSGSPADYAGRFIIAVSTDGTNFSDVYTSASNQASYSYTIPANARLVRARAYLAGGTTTLIDEEIVPVVSDGATGATGATGAAGATGATGRRGSVHLYAATTRVSWLDADADGLTAQAPHNGKIIADQVTLFNQAQGWSETRTWNGTGWIQLTEVIDGNLLVTGSIVGDKLAVNAVTANIIASKGITLNNAAYKMSLLTASQPILLEKDGVVNFALNPDGTGYFKGGLAASTVGLDAISVEARKGLNPYYSGLSETVTLAANTAIASGASAQLPNMTTLVVNDRVTLSVRLAANVSFIGENYATYTNSVYRVKFQKSINAGAWTDVAGSTQDLTVTGYSDPGRGYPEPEPSNCGYYYDYSYSVTDQLAAAGTTVAYRIVITCTTAGQGTSSGLVAATFNASKSAFVKNPYNTSSSVTRWTDKETGFTILTGRATVNADSSLTVSFGLTLSSVISFMAQRDFVTYNDWAAGAASATTTSVTLYNQYNTGALSWVVYGYIAP